MEAGPNSKGVEGVYKRETETKNQKSKKGREESMTSREGINKLERGTRNTLQPSTQKLKGHLKVVEILNKSKNAKIPVSFTQEAKGF